MYTSVLSPMVFRTSLRTYSSPIAMDSPMSKFGLGGLLMFVVVDALLLFKRSGEGIIVSG